MKPIKYKAIQLNKQSDLEVVDMELDSAKMYATMLFSGLCGTDKHAIQGSLNIDLPQILGHENVGIIDGKRYTWPTIIPCNNCKNCLQGLYNVCKAKNNLFGITTSKPMAGGFGKLTPIPEGTVLFEVPDEIDDDVAVLIETMASTKALNRVNLKDKNLLIIGSGPIGMLSAIHAHAKGAKKIGITGHWEQVQLIDSIINEFYKKNIPTEKIESEYDIVMDAGGNPGSLEYSIQAVKPRGIVIESGCMVKDFNFDVSKLVKKELTMITQLGYVPDDFKWAIELVKEYQDLLKPVITHKIPFDEFEQIPKIIEKEKHGKIMLKLTD